MKKKFLALVMTLVMVISLVPATALAAGPMRVIRPGTTPTQTYQFYVGDKMEDTQTIRSGDELKDPGIPSGEGEFLGWYIDGTDGTPLTFGTKTFEQSKTFTVTAKFEGVNYFYFMNSTEDDAIVSATKVLHQGDSKITSFADVAIPLDSTQGVAGWYTDKGLKNEVTSLSYNEDAGCVFLYPKIQEGFWITYESNGGSYVAPQFFTANRATEPTAPTRSGYAFKGWFKDLDLTQPADFSAIKEPTTVYAGWEVADTKYTVVHWWENADNDEFSYRESESKDGKTGEQTAALAKDYEGFTAQLITQETIAGDGSTIVNVYYNRNEYEVKFYYYIVDNGFWQIGNEIPEKKITAKYGAKIYKDWPGGIWVILTDDLKDETSDTGFRKFANEAEHDAYIEEHQNEYQANLMVMPLNGANYWYTNMNSPSTAEYYLETLDGKYELDHTDSGAIDISTISPGDCYAITGFTFNHYVSGVWTDEELIKYPFLKEEQYKDKWNGSEFYYTRDKYNVVYMNHSENPDKIAPYKYEADISSADDYIPDRPNGVPENYVFDSWYYNKELNVACDFDGKIMPANNITVYAKWVPPICKVKFMAYGEEVADYNNIPYGTSVSEKIPSVTWQEGDTFYGWAYDEAGTQPFNAGTLITKDIILYAQVSNGQSYTVSYNANGGIGKVATDPNHYVQNKAAKVLSSNGLTAPAAKVFRGWNTNANGTGKMYYPGSSILVSDNITLYAIWGDKTPGTTLTYHANGGSGADVTVKCRNNETVTVKAKDTFSRSGYTFKNWNTQADGKGTSFAPGAQVIVDNIGSNDLYAIWDKNSSGGHGGGPITIPDDVPTGLNGKDHYAYVVGYPDGLVYPQKNITRAEVATIFFRLLEDETREANMTKSNSYNDMKDGAWYTCAVSTLSKMGIIKGYEDGSFKPDASISRAEFAAIAARFDPDGDKTPATFSDVSSHWAKDEISIAANHGWIKGYEDGSFKPDQKITRAETMTLVNRVLKRLPETKDDLHKDMKTWPDNQKESAWFYLAVQEATNSHYQNLKKDGTHEKWESMRETRDWAALEK